MGEQFTFFWNGPFSQWYMCSFVVEGVRYNCAEQFMMAQKAIRFNDTLAHHLIMNSDSPKDQKRFGRSVSDFNVDYWNRVAKQVVYTGNYAKFTQNPSLKDNLLATVGTTLVEASPYDKIWGIGLREKDPKALTRSTWQGKNWLGEVLTQVREDLIKEGK
jgi:ribA/ribD-fused uncharacterized protein